MREQLKTTLIFKKYRWIKKTTKTPTSVKINLKKTAAITNNDRNGTKKKPVGKLSIILFYGYVPETSQALIGQYTKFIDIKINGSQPSSTDPPSSNIK